MGIVVGVDYSWLIIFALITWTLVNSYFPQHFPGWPFWLYWGVGLVASLVFFSSVLAHELAHSWMALRRGMEVQSITLFIFGGLARIAEEPGDPLTEFLMALAGPLSSFILAATFGLLWLLTRWISEPLGAFAQYLAVVNGGLGTLNLMPGFPLDGGRVLRSILWGLSGDLKGATRWASYAGQGVALLLIVWGLSQAFSRLLNGLWLIFIGWFLHDAARASYRQFLIREALQEVRVRDLMTRSYPTVEPRLSLAEVMDDYVLGSAHHAFPVVEGELLRGLICLHDIRAVPRAQWGETTVAQAMTPFEVLETVSPEDDGSQVLRRLSARDVGQLPVVEEGRLVGLLRRSDVIRFLRSHT